VLEFRETRGRSANFESAAVLAELNPLGSRADSDLDGCRIEAIDIIIAFGVFRRFIALEEIIGAILNQAFAVPETDRLCGACEKDPAYPWSGLISGYPESSLTRSALLTDIAADFAFVRLQVQWQTRQPSPIAHVQNR
jgi:hypothetical protein